MAKCVKCGKHGIFLKLDRSGLCLECSAAAEKERKEKRAAFISSQRQAFVDELRNLPAAPVGRDGLQTEKRDTSDISNLKYSTLTSKTDLSKLSEFVVVDTETTGLRSTSSIVEVSAILFSSGIPAALFSSLIRPPRKIPENSSSVNGITDDMVADAPHIYEVIPSLSEFIGGRPLVGHNLSFDLGYLYRDGLTLGPKQKFYDTLDIVSHVLKKPRAKWNAEDGEFSVDRNADYDVENYKLGTLCDYYGIWLSGAHRSAADCLATGKLFLELIKERTGKSL